VAVTPVDAFVDVIVAPGTNAPDGSCTNPVTVALLLCPATIPASSKKVRTNDVDTFVIGESPRKIGACPAVGIVSDTRNSLQLVVRPVHPTLEASAELNAAIGILHAIKCRTIFIRVV